MHYQYFGSAMCGTDGVYGAASLCRLHGHRMEVNAASSYARAPQCPVLTLHMVLSAQTRALRCPDLTWRMARPPYAHATRCPALRSCLAPSAYARDAMTGTDMQVSAARQPRARRCPGDPGPDALQGPV
eukprot:2864252-Rhodomonas_salina.5